jgi:hypothetical protein
MSAAPLTDTNAVRLADIAKANLEPWKRSSADGVGFALEPATNVNDPGCWLVATNTGKVARNAAWARWEKDFEPPLNLKDQPALAVDIEGDSSEAVVAIRLESPHAIAYGAVADHYIKVDFTGRRSFTLVETESTRWSDYGWNDGKGLYNVYRETINFGVIESVSVWLQNLPAGRQTKIRLGPIRALPMRSVVVKNPKIIMAGKTIEFPVGLESGSWIEGNSPDDCAAYGPKGEPLGKVSPRGDWPVLGSGVTALQFSCESGSAPKPRARVTVFAQGEPL